MPPASCRLSYRIEVGLSCLLAPHGSALAEQSRAEQSRRHRASRSGGPKVPRGRGDLEQVSLAAGKGASDLLLGCISMSASSMSNQTHFVSVVIAQFGELHNELRLVV